MPTVYAVASAKGGVAKTTTAAGLATAFAAAGESVVVVDGDLGSPTVADTLGVEPGATTLHDVLAGRAAPAAAVVDGPGGLQVVPGDPSLEAFAAVDPSGLEAVLTAFEDASSVVVDTSAGLTHATATVLALADETLLVTTPDPRSVTAAEKTRALTTRLGGHVIGAVLVRAGDETQGGDETAESQSLEELKTSVLERVPEDPTVGAAVAAGESLVTFNPEAPASRAYRRLAATLAGREGATDSGAESVTTELTDSQTIEEQPPAEPTDLTASTTDARETGVNETAADETESKVTESTTTESLDEGERTETVGVETRKPESADGDSGGESPENVSDPGSDDEPEPMSTALTGSTDTSVPPEDESVGQENETSERGGLLSRLFGR